MGDKTAPQPYRWWIALGLATCLLHAAAEARPSTVGELCEAAQSARDAGELDRAERLARRAVTLAEGGADRVEKGRALRQLGQVLIQVHRYDEAEAALVGSLDQLKPLGVTAELARTQHQIARVFRYRANYVTALDWLRRSEKIYRQLEDERGLQSSYNLYGVIYDFLGQVEQSLEWHRRALALARQRDDSSGIADGLYAIGEVHRALDQPTQALSYFQDALELDQASGIVRNIAYSHNKVGVTLLELNDLASARKHLTFARDLFADSKTRRDMLWAEANLGRLALTEGRIDDARGKLEQILEESEQEDWPVLENITRKALADLEYQEGRFDQALALLDAALVDALAQQALRDAFEIYRLQAKVLESAGRPGQALLAWRQGYQVEQQLFDELRASAMAAMQGEAEFERQSIALELAQQRQKVTSLALEREKNLRLAGLLTLLGLSIVTFLLYGRLLAHRQNQRLAQEVAAKTTELRARHHELEQAYDAVERASVTDPLTELANRRFLERHIEGDVAHSLRQYKTAGEATPINADLVFFMLDLDHFKAINDREGHAAGDAVLRGFSRLLEQHFRKGDTLVRWGGEEFLVVARFTDRRRAADIAERLRASVADHAFQLDGEHSVRVTCSIGFAAFPLDPRRPDALSWREVVELADQALYSVKQGPRNGWAGYCAAAPVDPTRPFAEWIPQALDQGVLRSVCSFEETPEEAPVLV